MKVCSFSISLVANYFHSLAQEKKTIERIFAFCSFQGKACFW